MVIYGLETFGDAGENPLEEAAGKQRPGSAQGAARVGGFSGPPSFSNSAPHSLHRHSAPHSLHPRCHQETVRDCLCGSQCEETGHPPSLALLPAELSSQHPPPLTGQKGGRGSPERGGRTLASGLRHLPPDCPAEASARVQVSLRPYRNQTPPVTSCRFLSWKRVPLVLHRRHRGPIQVCPCFGYFWFHPEFCINPPSNYLWPR